MTINCTQISYRSQDCIDMVNIASKNGTSPNMVLPNGQTVGEFAHLYMLFVLEMNRLRENERK